MTSIFDDNVSSVDYLGYEPYVNGFEYVIYECKDILSRPVVFGIHGKWGVGKSTFMELLKCRFKDNKEFNILEINPWEYPENTDFISVFSAELYKVIMKDNDFTMPLEVLSKFARSILSPLKFKAGNQFLSIEYDLSKYNYDDQKDKIDNMLKQYYDKKDDIREILDDKNIHDKKFLIFIDDLDRCRVDKVIEIMESIKLILNSRNCIFFLGCDPLFLKSAVASHYESFIKFEAKMNGIEENEMVNDFAKEYLEKIIQVPFNIPNINRNSIGTLIKGMLEGEDILENKNSYKNEDLYKKFKNSIKIEFLSKLFYNSNMLPRRIKRVVNLIFMNYVFLFYKRDLEINTHFLALITIIGDIDSKIYSTYFWSENLAKTDLKIWLIDKNEKEINKINNTKIIKCIEIFNEFEKTKENVYDIKTAIDNIDAYLNITNISVFQLDEPEYFKYKSDTQTGKVVKDFINRFMFKESLVNFIGWFFTSVYDKQLLRIGISQNLMIYLNENDKVSDKNFLCKFEYNGINDNMVIKFRDRNLRSKFNKPVRDRDEYLINDENSEEIKEIIVNAFSLLHENGKLQS
ncbi:KAP family P-loop NTPase fold protein [Clostridium aciditolerans]|uniref:KAP NTPase domain-containing protein n=1 Tax=Clostridium aciditolerans TaxID=339861 RepID=A0A934I2H4_9CLOT|nr:P-loop NTPase fold protein [Clostridium aciditolerans]MBI6874892.1 hypothetical protein [Clostridium aciditolerans]